MKRILLVFSAGVLTAAMVLAQAVPAFAAINCSDLEFDEEGGFTTSCQGGESITEPGGASNGGEVGGGGGHGAVECTALVGGYCEGDATGGGGGLRSDPATGEVAPGGFGQHCPYVSQPNSGTEYDCAGKDYTGKPSFAGISPSL